MLDGTVVVQPLTGTERDEITALVSRLRRADDARRDAHKAGVQQVQPADIAWAEEMNLPREFFDFFEIERQGV